MAWCRHGRLANGLDLAAGRVNLDDLAALCPAQRLLEGILRPGQADLVVWLVVGARTHVLVTLLGGDIAHVTEQVGDGVASQILAGGCDLDGDAWQVQAILLDGKSQIAGDVGLDTNGCVGGAAGLGQVFLDAVGGCRARRDVLGGDAAHVGSHGGDPVRARQPLAARLAAAGQVESLGEPRQGIGLLPLIVR